MPLKCKIFILGIILTLYGFVNFDISSASYTRQVASANIGVANYINNKESDYIAVLKIDSISFKRGLYDRDSPLNNLRENITFLDSSSMPDKHNGNVIIAGHSGNSKESYFKDLYKVKYDDVIEIYYNNKVYTYIVSDIYKVPKTGVVEIIRDRSKNTLTLITCASNNQQLVVISYLKE